MVKIEKGKSRKLNVLASEFYQRLNEKTIKGNFKANSLVSKLENLIANTSDTNRKAFLKEFSKNNYLLLNGVCTAVPSDLEKLTKHIDDLLIKYNIGKLYIENRTGKITESEFGKILADKIFNYSSFRKSKICEWLSEELDIPVCLYCNRMETSIVPNQRKIGSKKLLFDFDHYYSKVRYPYFSLSFYNLIPACHICNSNYKGDQKFTLATHLHPYVDNYNNIYKFSTDKPVLIRDINSFSITIDEQDLTNVNNIRADNITKIFGLRDIYQGKEYKLAILALWDKKAGHPESRIQELLNQDIAGYKRLIKKSDVLAYLNECPADENEIRRKTLGKFRRDFALEFGLLNC